MQGEAVERFCEVNSSAWRMGWSGVDGGGDGGEVIGGGGGEVVVEMVLAVISTDPRLLLSSLLHPHSLGSWRAMFHFPRPS